MYIYTVSQHLDIAVQKKWGGRIGGGNGRSTTLIKMGHSVLADQLSSNKTRNKIKTKTEKKKEKMLAANQENIPLQTFITRLSFGLEKTLTALVATAAGAEETAAAHSSISEHRRQAHMGGLVL